MAWYAHIRQVGREGAPTMLIVGPLPSVGDSLRVRSELPRLDTDFANHAIRLESGPEPKFRKSK